MSAASNRVRLQTLVVLDSGLELPDGALLSPPIASDAQPHRLFALSADSSSATTTKPESQILRTTFSSVPIVSNSELREEYQELGVALGELLAMDAGDEWRIEKPVYYVACHVAAELMDYQYPAPEVFTHGPKSVVFNWSNESTNLYLTVSADTLSALISTPQRIQRRIEFPTKQLFDPGLIFPALRSAQLEQPVVSIDKAASDLDD